MVASNTAYPSIHAICIRVTRMDACGVPVTGPKSVIVSEGQIKVDLKAERESGKEITQLNGNGKIIPGLQYKPKPQLKYMNMTLSMGLVDPELFNMLTADPLALDALGNSVGYSIGDTLPGYFAIETWSEVPGLACGTGANAKPYGYLCVPWMGNGVLGDHTLEESNLMLDIEANSQPGHQWGTGPYNVDLDNSATPAPGKLITPIGPRLQLRNQLVRVAPPLPTNGAVAYPLAA